MLLFRHIFQRLGCFTMLLHSCQNMNSLPTLTLGCDHTFVKQKNVLKLKLYCIEILSFNKTEHWFPCFHFAASATKTLEVSLTVCHSICKACYDFFVD